MSLSKNLSSSEQLICSPEFLFFPSCSLGTVFNVTAKGLAFQKSNSLRDQTHFISGLVIIFRTALILGLKFWALQSDPPNQTFWR